MKAMKVVIAGGGTSGHINPALAIADQIRLDHPDAEIRFVGTARGLESQLVPKAGYRVHPDPGPRFARPDQQSLLCRACRLFCRTGPVAPSAQVIST